MDDIYLTSDRDFAAYLMMRGAYCVGAVPAEDGSTRRNFVFIDLTDPKAKEETFFRSKRENMSAKLYADKLRLAKHMVHDPLTAEVYERIKRGGKNV